MGKMKMGNGGGGPAKRVDADLHQEMPTKDPEQIIIETIREIPVYIDRVVEIASPVQFVEKEVVEDYVPTNFVGESNQEPIKENILNNVNNTGLVTAGSSPLLGFVLIFLGVILFGFTGFALIKGGKGNQINNLEENNVESGGLN